jgi:hypothetical protein
MNYFFIFLSFLMLYSCENFKTQKNEVKTTTIAENSLENTVLITMYNSTMQPISIGSGFLYNSNTVITNLHVIEDAHFGEIQTTKNNAKHKILGVYAIDKINDIAILKINDINISNNLEIEEKTPKIGEKIYACGNPKGLNGTFSEGIVSALRDSLIQITAAISPGSSGGPIVNSLGKVIGIAVGSYTEGQNLNFIIPSIKFSLLIKNLKKEQLKTLPIFKDRHTKINDKELCDYVILKNFVTHKELYPDMHYHFPNNPYPNNQKNYNIEFSIYNKNSKHITNIKILAIYYDRENLPVDFGIGIFKCIVPPNLAKQVNHNFLDYSGKNVNFPLKKGFKIEYKVLDFDYYEI